MHSLHILLQKKRLGQANRLNRRKKFLKRKIPVRDAKNRMDYGFCVLFKKSSAAFFAFFTERFLQLPHSEGVLPGISPR